MTPSSFVPSEKRRCTPCACVFDIGRESCLSGCSCFPAIQKQSRHGHTCDLRSISRIAACDSYAERSVCDNAPHAASQAVILVAIRPDRTDPDDQAKRHGGGAKVNRDEKRCRAQREKTPALKNCAASSQNSCEKWMRFARSAAVGCYGST